MVEGPGTEGPPDPDPAKPGEGSDDDTPDLPPRPDPERLDQIEFAVRQLCGQAPLVVTVARGPIAPRYAPAELIGRLAERIAGVIQGVAGSQTMLYGVAPGKSMTLFFGDPEPAGHQEELAYQATFSAAERIAKLIEVDVDDEEFFSRAVGIGAPVRKYQPARPAR